MFKENYVISGKIVCKTGLHIGGSTDSIDIGGSDNPVIRDSVTNLPYIPGSSLKGKLRNLFELNDEVSAQSVIENDGKPSDDENSISVKVFGVSSDKKSQLKFPTRIIVRDSYPTKETEKLWKNQPEIVAGAEFKYENSINRIYSRADIRNIERIPKDSKFNFEIIFTVYEDDEDLIKYVFESMLLLEDNYLGGSGSRGFGKVKFDEITVEKRGSDYYKEDKEPEIIVENGDIPEAIEKISN